MGGFFITFEGGEGAGKSTQIRLLSRSLKQKGHALCLTREPGGTPLADRIRQELLDPKNQMAPQAELFMYEVARRDHVLSLIKPSLEAGVIVLCDRFTDATLAYQGYGRKLPLKMVQFFNDAATGGCHPHLTILMDLPVSAGLKRAQKRNQALDRLELEKKAFHDRVRRGYLEIARKNKKRFLVIDARKSVEYIQSIILREVEKRLHRFSSSSARSLSLRGTRGIRKKTNS